MLSGSSSEPLPYGYECKAVQASTNQDVKGRQPVISVPAPAKQRPCKDSKVDLRRHTSQPERSQYYVVHARGVSGLSAQLRVTRTGKHIERETRVKMSSRLLPPVLAGLSDHP